ncbi:Cysteine proteinase inhibitor 4 [Cardamine amara subsp. amara]|uniref:Cysteine proteinase inhibitor 4 n=1 Tax=Cardamine amara subsp. amara TaxID=228776 RepID=A0ABD0ZJ31_CARAN
MMMKTLICVSLILLPLVSVVESGLIGGWTPIKDVSDPSVTEIGKYAITEHNKQSKANLKYEKIVKGKTQVVAGTKYDLIIAAKSYGGVTKKYKAVVVERVWEHFRSLESFKAM